MKITYLGTAAAEGFPAVFCNCEFCKTARKLGGKNIRTRSQAIINDDLLIDLPADTYCHFLQNGIAGDTIKYLLITHSHSDHLYTGEFEMRSVPYAHNMRADCLEIYGSQGAYDILSKKGVSKNTSVAALKHFETVSFGSYTVTALPARHMLSDKANIYLIRGEKALLYAHDTGFFFDEVFEYLEKEKVVLDFISLDCTNVDIPISESGTHMDFENIGKVLEKLTDLGVINEKTVKVVNHFSHNGNPLHHLLEERAAKYGCIVSYDGLAIEF